MGALKRFRCMAISVFSKCRSSTGRRAIEIIWTASREREYSYNPALSFQQLRYMQLIGKHWFLKGLIRLSGQVFTFGMWEPYPYERSATTTITDPSHIAMF